MKRGYFINFWTGLSKAGVDKDPIIWHSMRNPSSDFILRYQNIAYLEGVIHYMENLWILEIFILRYFRIKIGFTMDITSFKNKNYWCMQTILDHLNIHCGLRSSVSFGSVITIQLRCIDIGEVTG